MNLEQLKQYFLMLVQTECIIREVRDGQGLTLDIIGKAMDIPAINIAMQMSKKKSLCDLAKEYCKYQYDIFDNTELIDTKWMEQQPHKIRVTEHGIGIES